MNNKHISNNQTLLALLTLTLFSFFFVEGMNISSKWSILVLFLGGFKFYIIFNNYMEMREAHQYWKILILSLLSVATLASALINSM